MIYKTRAFLEPIRELGAWGNQVTQNPRTDRPIQAEAGRRNRLAQGKAVGSTQQPILVGKSFVDVFNKLLKAE